MERMASAAANDDGAIESPLRQAIMRGLPAAIVATAMLTSCNGPTTPRTEPHRYAGGDDMAHGSAQGSNRGMPMTNTTAPDLSALAASLQQDAARDIPPFGAESVKLARRLGTAATGMLVQRVQARGADAFLALEALRVTDPAGYAAWPATERAAVYVTALQRNAFFNSWGQPGMSLTETSHAFAALGEDAVAVLAPLLDDKRDAPSSGSQDATLSRMNGNRVCDYAWVLINEARGVDYTYPSSPVDRDREIAAMRASLHKP